MIRSIDAEHYVLALKLKRDKVPSFDLYPYSLAAIRHLDTLEMHPAVTFIVGENGSGKSTLLEAIAVGAGFNAEGGTKNFLFDTRRSHSPLRVEPRISPRSASRLTSFRLRGARRTTSRSTRMSWHGSPRPRN